MPTQLEFTPRDAAAPVDLQPFADLVATLRGPRGCPWDRAQTHATLAPYAVEETFELVDAIELGSDAALREELGDVLLQVVLHAQLAADRGAFVLQDVVDGIGHKMLKRHPHVFGEAVADGAGAVVSRWREAKRAEGRTTLGGVPRSMPSLERADRIARRAAGVGFDWPSVHEVIDKLDEEVGELRAAVAHETPERALDELGDVLFAAVSTAIHLGGTAEAALRATLGRFEARFAVVERLAQHDGLALDGLTPEELDALWRRAKQSLELGE